MCSGRDQARLSSLQTSFNPLTPELFFEKMHPTALTRVSQQTDAADGRHETTWAVLRQFGYDNRLRLSRDFLFPKLIVPSGCSSELSPAGLHFLHSVFTKYDVVSYAEAMLL
nr:hypothetical transcript [Hymenolepis microstoma]